MFGNNIVFGSCVYEPKLALLSATEADGLASTSPNKDHGVYVKVTTSHDVKPTSFPPCLSPLD